MKFIATETRKKIFILFYIILLSLTLKFSYNYFILIIFKYDIKEDIFIICCINIYLCKIAISFQTIIDSKVNKGKKANENTMQ